MRRESKLVAREMEATNFESRKHEEFLELCAASVSERLSLDEEERLRAHLEVCDECKNRLRQFREIEQFGLPVLAPEDVADEHSVLRPSAQEQEQVLKRLLDLCAAEAAYSPLHETRLGLAKNGRTRIVEKRSRLYT